MSNQPDHFEQLKKLLALKKYELPPPRYFEDFSDRVVARLEAVQAEKSMPWWQRLGLDFSLKPALVGAFGVLASAAFLTGVFLSNPETGLQGSSFAFSQPGVLEPVRDQLATTSPEIVHASTDPVASAIPTFSAFSQPIRASWIVR